MLNSSAIGTTNRNLLAVLGDGLRIPARLRAGENGTPSAKVGSSKEGDPGKLGRCDDYLYADSDGPRRGGHRVQKLIGKDRSQGGWSSIHGRKLCRASPRPWLSRAP